MTPNVTCVGMDINKTMLKLAKLELQKTDYSGQVCFINASVEALPYADKSFDMVVSLISIYQWNYRLQGCREIYRVLKDKCVALIIVDSQHMSNDK